MAFRRGLPEFPREGITPQTPRQGVPAHRPPWTLGGFRSQTSGVPTGRWAGPDRSELDQAGPGSRPRQPGRTLIKRLEVACRVTLTDSRRMH